MHSLLRIIAGLHFLRLGLRLRLLRLCASPAAMPHQRIERPFFGLRYAGWLDNHIDWSVYFLGAYEREELLFLRDFLHHRSRRVCLDVGANTGHHSLFFASLFDQVHAFEPYAPVLEVLRERVLMNDLMARVQIHPFGLGALDETLFFHAPDSANTGTGWFGRVRDSKVKDISELPVRYGDEVLAGLDTAPVDFIKLDVEGHEVAALEGLRQTVATHRPVIWLEWNYPGDEAMRQRLLNCLPPGYTIQTLLTNQPRLGLFNRAGGVLRAADWGSYCNLLLSPGSRGGAT